MNYAYQGDSRTLRFTVLDENGSAMNLSGHTVTCTLYRAPTGQSVTARSAGGAIMLSPKAVSAVTKTSTSGGVTVGGDEDNICDVPLSPSDTAAFAEDVFYKLEVQEGGTKHTVASGVISFLRMAPDA